MRRTESKGGFLIYSWEYGNEKLASFGKKLELSCGDTWIIGNGFAFELIFPADSYLSPLAFVRECSKDTFQHWPDLWYSLQLRILKRHDTIHTTKTRDEVAEQLGIDP